MAVEKMYLVNIMSSLNNLEDFLEDVIKIGEIEPVDAFSQVASRSFSVRATEENVELTEDLSTISSFEKIDKVTIDKLNSIKKFLNIDQLNGDRHLKVKEVNLLYDELSSLIEEKERLEEEKEKLLSYENNLEILEKFGIDITKVEKLNYFGYRYGEVSKDGRFILKNNYENIPSLIFHLDNNLDNTYLNALDEVISIDNQTTKLRDDTDSIIENERNNTYNVSLNLDREYSKTTKEKTDEIYNDIMAEATTKTKSIADYYTKLKNQVDNLYQNHKEKIVDEVFDEIVNEEE